MSNNIVNTSNTVVVTANVIEYADKFKSFALKTAESIIEMGKVVYDAKNSLSDTEFETFCHQVGYKCESSTIRKLNVIGKQYNILLSRSGSLPSAWTTMYHIARLTAEQIDEKINEGVITPFIDGKNLAVKLGLEQPAVPKGTDQDLTFSVEFPFLPSIEFKMKLKQFLGELSAMKADVTESATLKAFLADPQPAMAQAA